MEMALGRSSAALTGDDAGSTVGRTGAAEASASGVLAAEPPAGAARPTGPETGELAASGTERTWREQVVR